MFSTIIKLMQPESVITPGQAPGNTPPPGQYDFIMQNANHNSGGLFSANAPIKTRILVVAGGCAILLVIALIFFAILSRPAGLSVSTLVGIAQKQTELARISQTPSENATGQAVQNFAATTRMTMLSERQIFVTFLQTHGSSVDPKTLQATRSLKTDQDLLAAKSSGTYDQIYIAIAQAQLAAYEQSLKAAFNAATTQSQRKLLNDAYMHAELLIAESKQSE